MLAKSLYERNDYSDKDLNYLDEPQKQALQEMINDIDGIDSCNLEFTQ